MIYEMLAIGKENAIPSKELCNALRLRDVRELRLMVQRERRNGAVILSSEKGYFLPGCKTEVEQFIRTTGRKAQSTMRCMKSAKKYLRDLEAVEAGQVSIFERDVISL